MAVIYYPKDQIMYRRDTVSASYEALVLSINPETVLYFDSGSGLNAISASYLPVTASWALSSSIGFVQSAETASHALTLKTQMATYSTVSSSFNPIVDISTGSCVLWLVPNSGSFIDAYALVSSSQYQSRVNYWQDQSGNGSDPFQVAGGMSSKYNLVYGVGTNGQEVGVLVENVASSNIGLKTPTLPLLAKPLWCFVVGKTTTQLGGGTTSVCAMLDGQSSTTRFGCWIGSAAQMYSGANLTMPETASLNNRWLLQSFKSHGTSSLIRNNGVQVVFGTSGTQAVPTAFTIGCDYAYDGGGGVILEMLVYKLITDADAVNIENYLMAKHSITP